jgi:hypothetical protein
MMASRSPLGRGQTGAVVRTARVDVRGAFESIARSTFDGDGMFPLAGKTFPKSGEELGTAIREALEEVLTFPKKGGGVKVGGGEFPEIKSLKIDLSGATVSVQNPPPAPQPKGKRTAGVSVGQLEVVGEPIYYEKSKGELELKAKGLSFDFAHDAKGNALLVLTDAKDGHVRVKITKDDLRGMLLAAASTAAKAQGVTIQDLEVNLEAEGERAVSADVRVKAKKMMMSGVINVKGRAEVDDNLVAKVSGLSCTGEGMIGGMAAGFLQGKLKSYEGKKFPLMAFSMGDVALRDLSISTKGAVQLTAAFGSKG